MLRTWRRGIRGDSPNGRTTRFARLCKLGLLPGLLLVGCSGDVRAGHPGLPAEQVLELPAPPALSPAQLAALPESTTFTTVPGAAPDPAPQDQNDGTVLRIPVRTAVYNQPDGMPIAALPPTELGSPTWVPVVEHQPGWARVLLPSRPDASTGWVFTGRGTQLTAAHDPNVVEVSVDARKLVLRNGNREVGSWTVAVGKPAAPTPRGRTFILASIKETVTHFSPIILPLGTHSNTYDSYGGGPGTVALHGWPDQKALGTAASDGCVRVPPDALHLLSTLPLGTLVLLHD